MFRCKAGRVNQVSATTVPCDGFMTAESRRRTGRLNETGAKRSLRAGVLTLALCSVRPCLASPAVGEHGVDAAARQASEPTQRTAGSSETASATRQLEWAPLNLSLFHPLALHMDSDTRRVALELGLLYSAVGEISGAAFNPLVIRNLGHVSGVQLGGLVSLVEGRGDGIHAAAVVTIGKGALRGLMLGGAAAVQAGPLLGVQLSATNIGLQSVYGVQLGVVNWGRAVNGVQLGLVNVARLKRGLQLGLVNVAERVEGVQLGLVNVSDDVVGYKFGLLNLPYTLRVATALWSAGPRLPINGGAHFSLATAPLYALLAVGYASESERNIVAPAYGLGVRARLSSWFLDFDLLYQPELAIVGDSLQVLRLRAAAGVQLLDQLAVFAGGGPLLERQASHDVAFEPHYFAGIQVY
ncbi:MAG TPA: hypothetical protein VJN18_24705 [Polyangiaceae bacterium]|nr:hypothetical protein [Polyangiaceae bacterium]